MTSFLTGTLTWQDVDQQIYDLVTGFVAANGNSVTAAPGDAWERTNVSLRIARCPTSGGIPTNINQIDMYWQWLGEGTPQRNQRWRGGLNAGMTVVTEQFNQEVFTDGNFVSENDLVAFWISVSKDRIIIALEGDISHTGIISLFYFGTYARLHTPAQDPVPVVAVNGNGTTGSGGSLQTFNTAGTGAVASAPDPFAENDPFLASISVIDHNLANPSVWDNRWYLYSFFLVSPTSHGALNRHYRGRLLDIFALATDGFWVSRDTLTDGADVYRLFKPNGGFAGYGNITFLQE